MLHIIHQSPFNHSSLTNCLAAFGEQDRLLLIENGVFCAIFGTQSAEQIIELAKQQKVFVLEPHAIERGVLSKLIEDIQRIDFNGFVDLTVTYAHIFRW